MALSIVNNRIEIVERATEHYLRGPAFEDLRMVKLPTDYANSAPATRLDADQSLTISPRRR